MDTPGKDLEVLKALGQNTDQIGVLRLEMSELPVQGGKPRIVKSCLHMNPWDLK